MKPVKICTLAIFALIFFNLNAVFAEKPAPTKVYSLGEVVVLGNATGEKVNTTYEINADDIAQKNIQSLDQALELLPGLDISKGSKGTPRVNVRGLRSRHTIILLNGIPLNSTWDQQFDPHLIPVENISKIKVSYGTHSVLYGQGGLAGVINIVTKQGTSGLHGDATAQMDERGNHYSRANLSGGKDRINFFAGASQNHQKGYLLSDSYDSNTYEDGGLRDNSDDKKVNFFGNMGFEVNKQLELGLTMGHGSGEFGTPGSTKDNSDPFGKNPKYDRVDDYETFSSQLSVDYDPAGLLSFRGWIFVNTQEQDDARYDDEDYDSMVRKNSYLDKTKTDIQGGTLQTNFDFDTAGSLAVSASAQEDKYTTDLDIVERNNNPAVNYYNEYETQLYSTAIEYRISPVNKLDLVAGFSSHWYEKEVGSDDDDISYMVGTSYDATDSTTLRASYARKIRFPSIRQLYDSNSGVSTLKPEKADNYEAGINQRLPWDMEIDLLVFFSDVQNYIEKDDNTNLFANNDEYEFKGVEIRIDKSILGKGRIGASYTWLDAKDKSDGTLKDELQYRPEHKFVLDASYRFGFGMTISADYMYISKQYLYNSTYDQGEISEYQIVNLKIEQNVYKENLSLFIGADNLFDEDYEESYGYPQPGRSAFAGLTVRFQ
ncbi:MAG TPA: TonB-dependent receptor [Desulfobacteraceae bacterium]|nr:TonB-dependent receptor [Desulfobacteraceae bacterium]